MLLDAPDQVERPYPYVGINDQPIVELSALVLANVNLQRESRTQGHMQ